MISVRTQLAGGRTTVGVVSREFFSRIHSRPGSRQSLCGVRGSDNGTYVTLRKYSLYVRTYSCKACGFTCSFSIVSNICTYLHRSVCVRLRCTRAKEHIFGPSRPCKTEAFFLVRGGTRGTAMHCAISCSHITLLLHRFFATALCGVLSSWACVATLETQRQVHGSQPRAMRELCNGKTLVRALRLCFPLR